MSRSKEVVFGTVYPVSEQVLSADDRELLSNLLRPGEPQNVFERNCFDTEILPDQMILLRQLGTTARSELPQDPALSLFRVIAMRGVMARFGAKNSHFYRRRPEEDQVPEVSLYLPLKGQLLVGRTPASIASERVEVSTRELIVVPQEHALEFTPESLILGLCFLSKPEVETID